MRIIGLYGHSNCGKSETLNALKELMCSEGVDIEWMQKSYEYNLSKGNVGLVQKGGYLR